MDDGHLAAVRRQHAVRQVAYAFVDDAGRHHCPSPSRPNSVSTATVRSASMPRSTAVIVASRPIGATMQIALADGLAPVSTSTCPQVISQDLGGHVPADRPHAVRQIGRYGDFFWHDLLVGLVGIDPCTPTTIKPGSHPVADKGLRLERTLIELFVGDHHRTGHVQPVVSISSNGPMQPAPPSRSTSSTWCGSCFS